MRTAVISGGSSGIGLASARRFVEAGCRVYVLDIQPPQISLDGLYFLSCDVSDITQIGQTVSSIIQSGDCVDTLVCSAGVHFSATVLNTTEADYKRVMDINFKSAFFLTQALLPLLLKNQHSAIVFVGSDQNLIAKPCSAIYGASKAALTSLTKTTALDYASQGVRANLVAVGTVNTPLYQAAIKRYCERTGKNEVAVHQAENDAQPIGRVGEAEEVASFIYFLCSDEASFMTGGIYPIDGGYTVT